MSTKFILHGGFTRVDNQLNQTFFRELVKEIPESGNILMCFFASGEEDKTDVFVELSEKIIQQAVGKDVSFTVATQDGFLKQLEMSDVIYFHGGHTRVLLATLKQYDNVQHFFNHKTVAGSSAGAYTLVKYGTAHDEEHVREGLGALPVRVVCHFQSEKLPPTETSLAELKNTAPELELVFLKDYEWKVFKL